MGPVHKLHDDFIISRIQKQTDTGTVSVISPIWQRAPPHPPTHVHLLISTHLPPCRQAGVHRATNHPNTQIEASLCFKMEATDYAATFNI